MNYKINHIPSLDGLRAISITLVLIDHFSYYCGYGINTFILGNLGVRIFFVISGFLITSILISELEKKSSLNLKKFYFRRTLRIFPAYYFYILTIFFLAVFGFYDISLFDFFFPLIYITDYFSSSPIEFVHTWSLSVEEQFYLLFPCIFLAFRSNKTKKILFLAIMIAPILRVLNYEAVRLPGEANMQIWFLFSFHTNMDVLASGCLLALCRNTLHKNKHYQKFIHSTTAFILLLLIIVFITMQYNFTYIFLGIGLTIVNTAIALIIDWLIVNSQNAVGKVLNSTPFVFIGTLSYSIYLWQQPFIHYSPKLWWTHFPYNIILLAAFSLFSYYVIEKSFLRWRQKWEKDIFAAKSSTSKLQTAIQYDFKKVASFTVKSPPQN